MRRYKFGAKSRSKLDGVHEDVVRLCEQALTESDHDFSIIDGYRTKEQQLTLYLDGKSELDGTPGQESAHQSGLAVDILPWKPGMYMWDYKDTDVLLVWYEVHRAFLRAARKLGLIIELGLTYNIGGRFDYPHVQINRPCDD